MQTLSSSNPEHILQEQIGTYFADMLGFVMFAYDWTNDRELQVCRLVEPYRSRYGCEFGPDKWACDLMERISAQVREHGFVPGGPAVEAIREGVASGHGIGKSAMVAWLTDWIMSTRPGAIGTITASTAPQLATKTWPQVIKWTKRCVTSHWFEITSGKGSMMMWRIGHKEDWFCSAQTCDEKNSQAFAGQHAVTSTSFYIFDEASNVPDSIEVVAKGGLTDGEPMQFAFGNPTERSGWFYEACHGNQRHRWNFTQIDSRDVQITNKKFLQELIDDYGIDSDIVKIRVRGMFPAQSSKQFISAADADAGLDRPLRPEAFNWAPKILSIDPAWDGEDEFVIGLRQGLRFEILRVIPKNDDDVHMANLIAQLEDENQADAVFIDKGYGTGIKSVGDTLGRAWLLVDFGSASTDPGYYNKRSQMHGQVRDWLKAGGSYHDYRGAKILHAEITAPWTVPRLDGCILIESKKDMKARGVASPNRLDCLAISFAYPVKRRTELEQAQHEAASRARLAAGGHDPYAAQVLNRRTMGHDPYASKSR